MFRNISILLCLFWSVSAWSALEFTMNHLSSGKVMAKKTIISQEGVRLDLGGGTYYLYDANKDALYIVLTPVKQYQIIKKQSALEYAENEMVVRKKQYDQMMANPDIMRNIAPGAAAKIREAVDFKKMSADLDAAKALQKEKKDMLSSATSVRSKKPKVVGGKRCIETVMDAPMSQTEICTATAKTLRMSPAEYKAFMGFQTYMQVVSAGVTPAPPRGEVLISLKHYNKKASRSGKTPPKRDRKPAFSKVLKSSKKIKLNPGYMSLPAGFTKARAS
jgi:hypothetical protein